MSQGFRNSLPDLQCPRQMGHAVVERPDPGRRREAAARNPAAAVLQRNRMGAGAGDLRPADPAAGPAGRSGADRAVHRREAAREPGQRLSLREHAASSARPGGSACARSTTEAHARWQRGFRELPGQSEGRGAALGAARRHAQRCMARHAAEAVFQAACCCTRRSASITRTRRHGARSASAARPRRAAMSGCRRTGAIRGRQWRKKKKMSDSPLVDPRAEGRARARPAAPRRLAADALLARRGRGRFRDRRDRGGRRHAGLQAGRIRVFGDRVRCRPVLAPARRFRLGREVAGKAVLARGADHRRRQPGPARLEQQRPERRRQHRAFSDGVAARPSRAVQGALEARLCGRLAGRSRGDVALLRRGRGGAEDFRPGKLSVGAEAAALPVPAARDQRRRPSAGARLRGARHRMGDDADRDFVGAARRRASLRLSRLLQVRLLDQRQAERAGHLDPARDPRRRRDPRSGDGRAHRDRPRRAGHRRPLPPRGQVAASAREKRRRRRLCDRDAAAPAQFGLREISGRPGQQQRSCRQIFHAAIEPRGVRHLRGGNPLVQGAAVAGDHRALELCRSRQGFSRRLRLYEPGPAWPSNGRRQSAPSAGCGAWNCATRWRNTTTWPG